MAEPSVRSILLLFLLGMTSAITQVSPPASSASSPWMETSLCPITDSLMVCQLKKGICSPISTVFSPPGGPVKAITVCANSTGTMLGPQFFMSVGLTFLASAPESLADKASSDPTTATAIRRCALNATGLLNPDLLTLNRTAVSNALSNAFITPELGAAVAAAVASCPEPVDYKLTDFLHCLKVSCMNNVAVTPFMSEATSLLTGASAPATAAAAIVAAKKPPPPKAPSSSAPAAGAFPYAGAGGAGAGGAGAYPFAGAAGGASGAGAFSFPGAAGGASGAGAYPFAGAFPFAGASGGASGAGAFPFSGASGGASGAGAFTFPGASGGASGAGAFPYAGSAGGASGGATGATGAGAFTYPSSSSGAAVSKTT